MVVERRLPEWFKVKAPGGPNFLELRSLVKRSQLHTVCEEAHCPNIGECWERKTASFMILGDTCTWRCHYCAVKTGRPDAVDHGEPRRLAETVRRLGLRYCVITSVTRDDLADGGASVFAECIRAIRRVTPECKVEVLIPYLKGDDAALATVLEAEPDVLNHNIETVERVFHRVRPKGDYRGSLRVLRRSLEMAPGIPTKSGMMVGLGETEDEVHATMQDLREAGCKLLTIGQYLRPSPVHFPLQRFYDPDEFRALSRAGDAMGFSHVAAGPLVRSSYLADEQAAAAQVLGP
jgi:lipoic acid synthetase